MTFPISFIYRSKLVLLGLLALHAFSDAAESGSGKQKSEAEIFRPVAGEFPPLEKAHSYRGELVFVDHANRRGSIRVSGGGVFRRNDPQPFALLPYATVRYRGAPADLRDIPLGTVMYVRAFLPPDPSISAVPVLPVDNKERKSGFGVAGTAPAENHVILFEDEPSHCQREGLIWKLKELEVKKHEGIIVASRAPKDGSAEGGDEESFTFNAATRIWRGRELLTLSDLIGEGTWPAEGKKSLGDQAVRLGITWKPTPGGVFTRFHISDIWLDDIAMERAVQVQTDVHKSFIRGRWMPAWIDAVEYGQFGRATLTATLFGGTDPSLFAEYTKGSYVFVNGVASNLKHTEGGSAGPTQMAARGKLIEVVKTGGEVPLGSSGIQISFEIDLITEGLRPTRTIRVRPAAWPDVHLPREEYMSDGAESVKERFPDAGIFPKY